MNEKFRFKIEECDSGIRLDRWLVLKINGKTRQYVQKLVDEGMVTVNGKKAKPSLKPKVGSLVEVNVPSPKNLDLKAVEMDLDVVYEDKNVIVINKSAGMVVHPGTGESHKEDSLVNALLYRCKGNLGGIGGVLRPGIVHRLDKDTSGLLIVAKNDEAHQYLSVQFKERKVDKVYYALVAGKITPENGSIEAPIGRDSRQRKKMAIRPVSSGKMALTRYKVIRYIGDNSLLEVKIITGRTHQIRVHFASIGHPLIGDNLYGRIKLNRQFNEEYGLKRIFLHAGKMALILPGYKKKTSFAVPLPKELEQVLKNMENS